MKVELHCHSTYSDGTVAAREVARRAGERGVELFCLTDHDTMAGYDETLDELGDQCTVLRGLELSCIAAEQTIHLLIYGVKEGPGLDVLRDRLRTVDGDRRTRIVMICERLAKLGIDLDPEPILAKAVGRTPGRPDVARALMEAGVVKRFKEAFERFLRDGGPAYVAVDRITLEEGLALGRAAGARMSLAHPHTVDSYALVRDFFVRLRGEGLEGIEALYGRYGRAEARGWLMLADELDLVVTGGSDFHGDIMPEVSRPGIDLPEQHAVRLREWIGLA